MFGPYFGTGKGYRPEIWQEGVVWYLKKQIKWLSEIFTPLWVNDKYLIFYTWKFKMLLQKCFTRMSGFRFGGIETWYFQVGKCIFSNFTYTYFDTLFGCKLWRLRLLGFCNWNRLNSIGPIGWINHEYFNTQCCWFKNCNLIGCEGPF